MRNIDLRDLALLADLVDGNHITKITGLPAKGFRLDRQIDAVYKRLKRLEANGYVGRGFRLSNAETFFITEAGIKLYEGAMN